MRVTAVVVAYNRCELLLESLAALGAQSYPLSSIVVVDNASSDGSPDAVRSSHPDVDLIELARNTGGAGGFAVGIEHAITGHEADLVWIMDDDTIPTPSALEALMRARESHPDSPTVLGSRVLWTDGSDHPMNTPRRKPFARARERRNAALANAMPVRSSSFVSCLVDAAAVRRSGLPVAEYFIWNDDFEFTARLLRRGVGIYCPESVVIHKTKALAATDVDPGPRFYYEVRNKIWLFRFSSALSPFELPLYLVASARRWTFTMLRSRDRSTLRDGFARGWRDGFARPPRSNGEFLSGLGPSTDAVTAFERFARGSVHD